MTCPLQIRRSFLEELGVHNNWTIVDLIFREFYTGSDQDLTDQERDVLEGLFSTKLYVQKEIEYSYMSTRYTAEMSVTYIIGFVSTAVETRPLPELKSGSI